MPYVGVDLWTFRPLAVSPPAWTFRLLDVSPPGRFALWTIRPLDDSPPGRFAPYMWTFRSLDVSPLDVSPRELSFVGVSPSRSGRTV